MADGAGAVRDIEIEAADADGSDEPARVPTFCFDPKALPAANNSCSHVTPFTSRYFHKTTRGIEKMIAKVLRRVADHATKPAAVKQTGLDKADPLIRFFSKDGATLANYLALDDVSVANAFQRMCGAPDREVADLARRPVGRRL